MTKIRYTALALSCFALALIWPNAAPAQSNVDTADVYGLWLNEEGTGTIRIKDCGAGPMEGTPCGMIETAQIPEGEPVTDVNNEDPALRDQPIIGLTMLNGFEQSKGKWKKGQIYNPEDGNRYKSSISLDEDNANTLKVKGCVAFLCQTQRWTRVDERALVGG